VTDLLSAVHPVVMGVLNVTPDSFSDGGRYADHAAAVAHGVRMSAEGADIVDVGGESTRPGAERVDAATEAARVLPVIRDLAAEGVPMSIDTDPGGGGRGGARRPARRW
jgi:dihydropteroate synthase